MHRMSLKRQSTLSALNSNNDTKNEEIDEHRINGKELVQEDTSSSSSVTQKGTIFSKTAHQSLILDSDTDKNTDQDHQTNDQYANKLKDKLKNKSPTTEPSSLSASLESPTLNLSQQRNSHVASNKDVNDKKGEASKEAIEKEAIIEKEEAQDIKDEEKRRKVRPTVKRRSRRLSLKKLMELRQMEEENEKEDESKQQNQNNKPDRKRIRLKTFGRKMSLKNLMDHRMQQQHIASRQKSLNNLIEKISSEEKKEKPTTPESPMSPKLQTRGIKESHSTPNLRKMDPKADPKAAALASHAKFKQLFNCKSDPIHEIPTVNDVDQVYPEFIIEALKQKTKVKQHYVVDPSHELKKTCKIFIGKSSRIQPTQFKNGEERITIDKKCMKQFIESQDIPITKTTLNIGMDLWQGKRTHMEDDFLVIENAQDLYGENINGDMKIHAMLVLDGHLGKLAATFTKTHLLHNFLTLLKENDSCDEMETKLKQAFHQTNAQYLREAYRYSLKSGTCATLACLIERNGKTFLLSANVGDAMAFLVTKQQKSIPLTTKHDPLEEQDRIRSAGGEVVFWMNAPRVNGILNIARSIGDASLNHLVPADASTKQLVLSDCHDYIIMASDGIWNVLSIDDVISTLSSLPTRCGDTASASLLELARSRSATDNCSIIVHYI